MHIEDKFIDCLHAKHRWRSALATSAGQFCCCELSPRWFCAQRELALAQHGGNRLRKRRSTEKVLKR